MLKKYKSPDQLRLVGKAWEIRYALRQELKHREANISLLEMLTISKRQPSA